MIGNTMVNHDAIKKEAIMTFDSFIEPHDDYFEHKIGSPIVIDGPNVEYILNKQGFRSEDFSQFDNDNYNILVGGDSFTFGDSLPLNCSYPYMLRDAIAKVSDKPVKYYNTGICGSSVHQVVKNTTAFIRSYGSPDFIFLLIPISSRGIVFDSKSGLFERGMHEKQWVLENDHISMKTKKRYFDGFNYNESILLAVDLMHMMEDICKARNIPLLWSCYDEDDTLVYESSNFSNFISLNKNLDIKNNEGLPYWDIARDNVHPGARFHKYLTECILAEMI